MPYQILQHTADLRLRVYADSLEQLFYEAIRGMAGIMKHDTAISKPAIVRKVVIESQDRTMLLVDFLNEVLTLAQTNKEIYTEVKFEHFDKERFKFSKICYTMSS